jgi:hypothetical protein
MENAAKSIEPVLVGSGSSSERFERGVVFACARFDQSFDFESCRIKNAQGV